jgi:hypothetical protein
VKVALTDTIRKSPGMCLGICSSHSIQIHVTLNATRIITLYVVTGYAPLDVLSGPQAVTASARADTAEDPGQGFAWNRTMPDWLEAILLSLYPVTVNAIVRFVAALALSFLANGIKGMRKPITQFVLSLYRLDNISATGWRRLKHSRGGTRRHTQ